MRVAMVTSFPRDPEDPCGGVQSVSVHLARALSQLGGVELDIVTDDADCAEPETSQWGDIRIHRLPHPGRSKLGNAVGPGRRQMMRYLTQLGPDVVHTHGVYGMMVRGLQIPRVFTVHGLISREVRLFGEKMVALRAWLWKRKEQGGWADQPHVISINPYVREQIAGIVTGVIHDIDNPIGASCFDIDRREEPTRIFCAGTICMRKNTLGLLRGFAKLLGEGVKAELRLSGDGDDDYLRQVRQFIRDNALAEHVKLLGRVNYDSIREEMSRAAIFT
ncbi:MAG: glycosyltransferase family 4 protein, partial [bacterium]|nr:glycosyltransferase family 4 protein [bacterium]